MPLMCFGRGGRLKTIVTELEGGVKRDWSECLRGAFGSECICPDVVTGLNQRSANRSGPRPVGNTEQGAYTELRSGPRPRNFGCDE